MWKWFSLGQKSFDRLHYTLKSEDLNGTITTDMVFEPFLINPPMYILKSIMVKSNKNQIFIPFIILFDSVGSKFSLSG